MTAQPAPPDLPPMPSAKPAVLPERPASQPAPVSGSSGFGTRRLRQMVGILASGGLALIVAVLFFQAIARPGLRPTDLMATIEAQTELGIFNQKMGAAPGEVLMTEAQYRSRIAEADRSGQARAELAFQKEMTAIQADRERVVTAYQTLYQRTNMIAQAGLQVEAQAQQFRQELIASTNGGRAVVLAVYDGLCALGDASSCEAARKLRGDMVTEAGDLTEGDLARKVRELMTGVDDPATFVTQADQRRNGLPALPQH